jgi:hypothetical protein
MERQANTDEMERELRATISARREVGPDYEDHLIEAFMQKLNQRALMPPVVVQQPMRGPTSGQRLGLGIVSVACMIPLSAIALSVSGFFAFLVVAMVVLGINIVFDASR